MFLVDGALVILHLYAVVAIALALQRVAVKRLALTTHLACGVLLVVRASVAVFIGRLVGVVSWFAFSHNSFNSCNLWLCKVRLSVYAPVGHVVRTLRHDDVRDSMAVFLCHLCAILLRCASVQCRQPFFPLRHRLL